MKNKVPKLRFPEFSGEWKINKIKEIAPLQRGFDLTNSQLKEGIYPVVYSNGVSNYHNEFKVNGPGVVTGRSGTIGKIHFIEQNYWPHNTSLWVTNFYNNYPKYIYYLYHHMGIDRFSSGSGVPTLNRNDVHDYKVATPSLPEQEKIANFMSSVDIKIEKLEKKKELLEKYKKGMMQKLFSQKLRFKDENGNDYPEWEEKRLGEIFEHRSERGFEDLELLSVTMRDGVKKRTDIEGKDNSSEDKSNYKRVYKQDIVYNSMRMWQGASGISLYDGIVSPAYTVLKGNKSNSSIYFGYLFKMTKMINIFQRNSQGLTSDTWNLKYPQLSLIKIICPSLAEQEKIANFLSSIDEKIELIEKELEGVKEFKKGLLQQMFI